MVMYHMHQYQNQNNKNNNIKDHNMVQICIINHNFKLLKIHFKILVYNIIKDNINLLQIFNQLKKLKMIILMD